MKAARIGSVEPDMVRFIEQKSLAHTQEDAAKGETSDDDDDDGAGTVEQIFEEDFLMMMVQTSSSRIIEEGFLTSAFGTGVALPSQ